MAVRQDRLMPHISKNKLALGGVKWFLASQAQRKVYVGQWGSARVDPAYRRASSRRLLYAKQIFLARQKERMGRSPFETPDMFVK